MALKDRRFLFLQGPQSYFFAQLFDALTARGVRAGKVNFCGGDVFLWGRRPADWYRGTVYDWPTWIGKKFREEKVTDLCLYGDWRPLHWEAIRLARNLGIRIWVFEEGYLRSGYSTLEENGVNGRSLLPSSAHEIHALASSLAESEAPVFENDLRDKVHKAILHHVGNVLLWPCFYRYKTHRPQNIFFELIGLLPRFLRRKDRQRRSQATLTAFYEDKSPYFFFPLQLNSDSQVQLYSPYVRMQEAIAGVLASFSKHAPDKTRLLIRNHPLDNGLISYRKLIRAFSRELGIENRVFFVEDGPTNQMVEQSCGVILINSTVGMMALEAGKSVYCLGRAVYNIEGLTQCYPFTTVDDFWNHTVAPSARLWTDFKKVLKERALIEGNFYSPAAQKRAVEAAIHRFEHPIAKAKSK